MRRSLGRLDSSSVIGRVFGPIVGYSACPVAHFTRRLLIAFGAAALGALPLSTVAAQQQSPSVSPMIGGNALISVSPASGNVSSPGNSTLSYTFSVGNSGTAGTTVSFTVQCSGAVSGCSASPTSASIGANRSITVTVTYHTASTGTGDFNLHASWPSGNTADGDIIVTLPTYTVAVTPDSVDYYAEQRVSTNYGFTVKNNGSAAATYNLTSICTGGETGCSPRQTSVSLSAGASTTVYVDFSTGDPNVSGIGTVSLTATGPSNSSRGVIRVIPLSPQPQVTAIDGTSSASTNSSGTYHFQVALTGNSSPATYSLQVTGCTAPLTNCSVPGTVTVYAGSPQTVTVNFQTQGASGTGQVTLRAYATNTVHAYESSATGSVNVASRLSVSTAFMNNDDQDMSLCAASCFAATVSKSTVPYYTLDAPRSLTLVYNGDRAFPRPFVYADVSITSPPSGVSNYWLEIKRQGANIPFINGETKLIFQGTSTPATSYRLAGQLDMSSYSTGVYPVSMVATAVYANGTTDVTTVNTNLLVVNTGSSQIAKGWGIAGLQRLSFQSEANVYLVEDGNGSATYYAGPGSTAADFTTLNLSGSVWTRAYPDGTKVLFGSNGLMTTIIDRLGRPTQVQYVPNSIRLAAMIDPMRVAGRTTVPYLSITYGANGIASITETGGSGIGRQTTVNVDATGHLTSITDPDSKSTGFGYDAQGRLSTVTDRLGNTSTYAYSGTWKLKQVISPQIPVDHHDGTTTMQSSVVTINAWQSVGVPTAATATTPAPLVRPDTVTARITDANGYTSTFTPDRWGQPLRVTDPIGNVTTISRPNGGIFPSSVTHPNGMVDAMQYGNGAGGAGPYLIASTPAGGQATYYHYGVAGQVDSVSGNGVVAEHRVLDAYGRPTSIRYGSDPANTYQYSYSDAVTMEVTSSFDPQGHSASYSYDPVFGNLMQSTLPGSRTSSRTFDAYGRPLKVAASGARPSETVYDILNRAVASYDTLSTAGDTLGVTPTRYSYDAIYPTTVTDALGQIYRADHDALGNTSRSYSANSTTVYTSYRYDAGGRASSTTNRRGQRVEVRYDAIGRVVSKRGDNTPTDSLTYSTDGSRVTASNANATVTTAAARDGMSDTTTTALGGQQFVVLHVAPSMLSSPLTTTITSSTIIGFSTQSFGRDNVTGALSSITLSGTQPGSGTTSFQYNPDMLRTGTTWPGGAARGEHYTGLHERDSSTFSVAFENLHFRTAYSYDTLGRVASVHRFSPPEPAPDVFYSYDNMGRLSGVSGPPAGAVCGAGDPNYGASPGCSLSPGMGSITPETYTYDAVGNRTDAGGRSDAGNRLRHLGVFDLDYDADGNLVRKYSSVTGETQVFSWSAENRLSDVVNGGQSVHYDYDALGHPVRKSRSGVVDRYWLWDGDQWLAEFDANMNRVADYAYYPGVDQPFAVTFGQTAATSTRYFDQDELGNVLGHFKDTPTRFGAVTQRNTYSTWGKPTITIDASSRVLWKGLMWEGDIVGMYYVRNRWYDPDVGRFTSEDPIGLAGGVNQYAFAGDDPVNGRDPSGLVLDPCEDQGGHWQTNSDGGEMCVGAGGSSGEPPWLAPVVVTGSPYSNPNTWVDPRDPVDPPSIQGGSFGTGDGGPGGGNAGAASSTPEPTPKWRSARCLSAGAGLGLAGLNTFAWFTGGGEAALAARGVWKIGGAVTRSIAEHAATDATTGKLAFTGFETAFTLQAFGEHFDTVAKVQATLELFPVLDVASTFYTVYKSCH